MKDYVGILSGSQFDPPTPMSDDSQSDSGWEKKSLVWNLASRKRCDFENAETLRFLVRTPKNRSDSSAFLLLFFCDFLAIFCDFCSKTCDLNFVI